MSALTAPTAQTTSMISRSTAAFGASCAIGGLTWIGSFVVAAFGEEGPTALLAVLLAMAATGTLLAAVISAAEYTAATTANHAQEVTAAMALITADLEQMSVKLDRIDPWTIYTAVAADILNEDHRKPH